MCGAKLSEAKIGGAEGIRTLDPHVANVVLSQLSYRPTGTAGRGLYPQAEESRKAARMRAMSRDLGATPNPKRRIFSGLVAILLAAALFPLLLEFHSTAQEHSALDRPVEVFIGASHPTQPAHVEASASAERERCTTCILQLQALGRMQLAPILVARIATPLAEVCRQWHAPAFSSFVPSSPRAPPAASSAA